MITIRVHHHHYDAPQQPVLQIVNTLQQVLTAVHTVIINQETIMATLKDIADAEAGEGAAIQNVLANLASLKADLATAQANGADPAEMQAIVDKIHANTALLTGALPPPVTVPVIDPAKPDEPTKAADPAPATPAEPAPPAVATPPAVEAKTDGA